MLAAETRPSLALLLSLNTVDCVQFLASTERAYQSTAALFAELYRHIHQKYHRLSYR